MKTLSFRRLLIAISLAVFAFPVTAQGVVVVAGGGREGDQGDTSSWSYQLYRKLIENGDRNGDGVVKVAILTTLLEVNDPTWYTHAEASTTASPAGLGLSHTQAVAQAQLDDAFLPSYFQWIGQTLGKTTQAVNVEVATLADANNAAKVGVVANVDAIFIKGGDQGDYYDRWNSTLLETHIRTVVQTRAGAIGGTSAGAMSQSQYSFSGGADLISADVLSDAKSVFLDDVSQPGSSGIHTDFLGFVPGVLIETHYTQRARMARLLGIMARAVEDSGNHSILGIGLDQKTGLAIQNGVAEVIGNGEVAFVKESSDTLLRRDAGRPLFYTNLVLDRLTAGWKYSLSLRTPITSPLPSGVSAVTYAGDGATNTGTLSISGSVEADASRFDRRASYAPSDYALPVSTGSPYIKASLGFTDAGNATSRGAKQETLFRGLYDLPNLTGVLAFSGATLSRTTATPDALAFGGSLSTLIIDAKACTYKGLSPSISSYASTGGTLRAAALTNLRVHVLGETSVASRGVSYNSRLHTLVGAPDGSGGGGGGSGSTSELEPNDTRSSANDLTNATFPVNVSGQISSTTDIDHFKLSLAAGRQLNIDFSMPSDKDYDVYLLSASGVIEARSTRVGNGVAEAIRFTNTSSGTNTYYIKLVGYAGANSSTLYGLSIAKP